MLALFTFGERLTGYTYFVRMERKVSLLKQLNDLAQNGVDKNSDLILQRDFSLLRDFAFSPH